MKILFVTSDRTDAQRGAQALHGIAPNGTFTWTQTPTSALRWLQANRDAAAVVIEAEQQSREGSSFVEQVRALGLGTRVVVVPSAGLATWQPAPRVGRTVAGPAHTLQHEEQRLARQVARAEARLAEEEARHRAAVARAEKLTVALQRRLLELEAALEESRQAQKTREFAAADRLARREAELGAALARATANQAAVEQRLAESIARADQVRHRAQADLEAAALREGALKNQIAEASAARETLQQRLAALETARVDADRRHATRVAEALARLSDLQTRYDAVLTIHATARVNLEQQLADADAARQQLVSDAAAAAARETALKDRVAREATAREAFERDFRAAEAARADAERRHAAELAEAAARLAELQRAYEAALAEHAAARTAFEHRVADAEDRHAAALAESAAHLADLQRTYEAALTEHEGARTAFEQQLADADAARQQLLSAAGDAAAREAALTELIVRETTEREALERKLADAEVTRADAERRHATELAAAAAHFSDLESAYDAAEAEHANARTAFEQQLADAAAAGQRLVAEATAAAEREASLTDQLARETAAREALERDLAAAEAARADADRRHATELTRAAARLADLQTAYDAAVAEHAAARAAFEQQLADAAADAAAAEQAHRSLESDLTETRTHANRARRRLLEAAMRRRRRSREQIAQLERQLASERATAERALSVAREELREAHERLERLQSTLEIEREEHERRRLASEADLTRLSAEYDQARQSLDHLGISFAALEQVAAGNAAERARLESALAERDAQLRAQVERHAAADRAATETIEALRHDLQAARTQAAALQSDAERARVLQKQLEESEKESRRLFERAPYGLCRFMPDGAFVKANHSFARLLGYRKVDDIRSVSLGTLFECAADLRWLIERAVGTAATQTIETALKAKGGHRVDVRLHALSHADGMVDVAAQDITSVRRLEARLREAQRMEAVGRLASELAVTCDMVLRDVTHGGREWLAAIDGAPELRQRGELLFGEVTRAAGYLREFSVYGRKQMSALAPVSVQRVIRDLAPVLKRVAGDDIEWVLPKMSAPVSVDVDAERVERVLVNVASYARERMPHGGRVKIDVATTVLGHDFIAKYPNVRPGAHVLITIAEIKRGDRPGWVQLPPESTAAVASPQAASDNAGVDLGALLALLGDCGGHLWIAAERSGNMTLKVHLPKRVSPDAGESAAPATRTRRVRQLAGWFRN